MSIKTFVFLGVFSFLGNMIFAQHVTTSDEYNFLTTVHSKNFKQVKPGYHIKFLGELPYPNCLIHYEALISDKDQSISAFSVTISEVKTDKYWNLCIPLGDGPMNVKYEKDLSPVRKASSFTTYKNSISEMAKLYPALRNSVANTD